MVAASVKHVGLALNGFGISVNAEQLLHLGISGAKLDMAQYAVAEGSESA